MLLAFVLMMLPVRADDGLPSCDTPRQAANTLLALLQPDRYDPVGAATCLDLAPETETDGPMLAVQLKSVLDARGYYVPVDELPDEPAPVDEEGEPLEFIVPVERFPVAVLDRGTDGQWRWSRSTMKATPSLYAQTFQGLAGMGDLVLTCTGNLSRNRRVGLALGEGKTLQQAVDELGQVAEGVATARSAFELGGRLDVELPITEEVYRLLYEDKPAREALMSLLGRRRRAEQDDDALSK